MTESKNNKSKETNSQKQCKSCFQRIHLSATVCHYCSQRQSWWGRHFGDITIWVSIVMVGISIVQLFLATKERIDASEIVDQLQSISLATAKATITDLMAANFFAGTTLKTRLDLHDQIIANLKKIGVPENKIKDAEEMWKKGVGIIYHRGIRDALEGRTEPSTVNMKASPELRKASEEFQKMLDFEQWKVPSPDEMESFIKEKGFMNNAVKELIIDYRYFLETGNIQRRSVFEKL
jgi:hypothetical protein